MTWSPDTAPARRALVLVVDDASDMRELLRDVLTEQDYEVETASSGGQALSALATRIPDLVITDLLMPGMDGFSLRAEMLRRPELANVPVIVLSSFWQRPSETLDVVDVIGKPLDMQRLLEAVERATASTTLTAPGGEDANQTASGGGTTGATTNDQTGMGTARRRDASRI